MKSQKWAYALAIALFGLGIGYVLRFTVPEPRYDLIFQDLPMIVSAFWITLGLSLVTLVASMICGFGLFLMLRSKLPLVRAVAVVFKELVMGTPLLVMIFLAVYVIGNWIGVNDKLTLGVVAMTLYMSPYLANGYETAACVVDRDQYTVMDLYHFSAYQRYRYVILPQMVRPLIPTLMNHLSTIVKGSALLKIVSVGEISYIITVISTKNWAAIEGYYVMWMIYLIITIPLSLATQALGRRWAK